MATLVDTAPHAPGPLAPPAMAPATRLRRRVYAALVSRRVDHFVTLLVVINALILGALT